MQGSLHCFAHLLLGDLHVGLLPDLALLNLELALLKVIQALLKSEEPAGIGLAFE